MKKRLNPISPAVIDAAVERIRRMTPEEALAFLTYRTPGIEETDMMGMSSTETKPIGPDKRRKAAKKVAPVS